MISKEFEQYLETQINRKIINTKKHRKHPLFEVPNGTPSMCSTCHHKVTPQGYFHWTSHANDCLNLRGGFIELPPHWFKATVLKCFCHDVPITDCTTGRNKLK